MKKIGSIQNFTGGISSTSKKIGPKNSFAYGRSIDFRSEPTEFTILPKTSKISGSTVTDLPMGFDLACTYLYAIGDEGNVYRIDSSDTVTKEYTLIDSVGNGIAYFPEDKYLYLAGNKSISRKSQACESTGNYYDNFLENEGGEPTNTKSIRFNGTNQSASRADTSSLSITGDITLEAYVKPESLPTGTDQMTFISKWDESGTLRSYKFGIIPVANYFGDGSDGALTISTNTTDAPIDSACTGTAGTNTLSATNASFVAGQQVLIHQSQGTSAGQWERGEISSYTSGTITLAENLIGTYTTGAQVLVLKQYTDVTVNSGVTWTAKAWNGTVGGILAFVANGTVTVTGTIKCDGGDGSTGTSGTVAGGTGGGFRGGAGRFYSSAPLVAYCGESSTAASSVLPDSRANGMGGGGGNQTITGGNKSGGGGGHYGYNSGGGSGGINGRGLAGFGGGTGGSSDLTTMVFGGAGGGGIAQNGDGSAGGGGGSGGIIFISGVDVTVTGYVSSKGGAGGAPLQYWKSGGGGAGGSVLIKCQTADIGTAKITTRGGLGSGPDGFINGYEGLGANGRVHIDYLTSYTGSVTYGDLSATQDVTLGSSDGHALRFYVSSTGDNSETYTQAIDNPQDTWNRFSVAWDASASTAYFYQNSQLIGTKTGSLTAIHDNASAFALGQYENSGGTLTGYYHGYMDDVRVWNTLRSSTQIATNSNKVLIGTENGLVAYYKCDDNVEDQQTAGNNDLTANNTPTYSTDVPFSGVSTRGDEDIFIDTSGQTYTLGTSLSEGATHRQTFTPTKDPVKSIAFNIDTKGTGDWTVVVHDSLNREQASITVANADLLTGVYEFIFSESFRPVLNAEYHVHVYSTVADGEIVTGTINDMETAYLKTYYQILVDDEYHPMEQFLNYLVIGNERYVAVLEAGSIYKPHRLILPSGYRVRKFAFWGEYIAIGTWRGTDITDTDQGRIFFWDGTSDTYVEPLNVPQGAINAMFGTQSRLTIAAGYKGQILDYTGGSEANQIFSIPERAKTDYLEIAPNAITMWQNMICIGGTFNTNSSTVHQGIYTWGRKDQLYNKSLGFDYPLSIGDQMTSLTKVASLFPRGQKLYIGYQNATSYGIDIVDATADPYATATLELLITDFGNLAGQSLPLVAKASFNPLASGESVAIKYKRDRASSWTTLYTEDTAGATEARAKMNVRLREAQFAIDLSTTTTTAPTVIDFSLYTEDEVDTRNI